MYKIVLLLAVIGPAPPSLAVCQELSGLASRAEAKNQASAPQGDRLGNDLAPRGVRHCDIIGNLVSQRLNAVLDIRDHQVHPKPNYQMHSRCSQNSDEENSLHAAAGLNQALIDELEEMAKLDQVAAGVPQGQYKGMSDTQWGAFKKETFETHHQRLEEIFEKHGFVGYDVAGVDGSNHFWLMTQHCDHVPEFQVRVLKKMKIEVEAGNADPSRYAMLIDRVNLNTGKQQIYGTQLGYDTDKCQAFAKNLADADAVNGLRSAVGLRPLEDYLDSMSRAHFEMNKERYLEIGITAPALYVKD